MFIKHPKFILEMFKYISKKDIVCGSCIYKKTEVL